MDLKRVVITGLGALTPIGNSVTEYWEALLNGKSGTAPITYFDTTLFPSKIACELKNFNILDHIDNKDARRMDPCSHYAIVSTMEAIRDSGLELKDVSAERVGVIMGTGVGGFTSSTECCHTYIEQHNNPRINPFFIPKVVSDSIAGNISIHYGFKGPNYTTASACASAANAIIDACHFIQLGKADIIVSGGSEACIVAEAVAGFSAMKALSMRNEDFATASRPFDKDRDGFVIGEGAGTLILEEYGHAKARGAKIYAEIVGAGLSADAHHITSPHPEGTGAADAMRLAVFDAGISPDEVDSINMHGTSTMLGDLSECKAIANVFGEHAKDMVLNSTKSMTGHLLGAAAAIESIASVLALQNNIVPPTINQFERDPQIDPTWNFAANAPVKRELNYILCNSFGFGGHNVSILFKKI